MPEPNKLYITLWDVIILFTTGILETPLKNKDTVCSNPRITEILEYWIFNSSPASWTFEAPSMFFSYVLNKSITYTVETSENGPPQKNAPPPFFLSLAWGAFQYFSVFFLDFFNFHYVGLIIYEIWHHYLPGKSPCLNESQRLIDSRKKLKNWVPRTPPLFSQSSLGCVSVFFWIFSGFF